MENIFYLFIFSFERHVNTKFENENIENDFHDENKEGNISRTEENSFKYKSYKIHRTIIKFNYFVNNCFGG